MDGRPAGAVCSAVFVETVADPIGLAVFMVPLGFGEVVAAVEATVSELEVVSV